MRESSDLTLSNRALKLRSFNYKPPLSPRAGLQHLDNSLLGGNSELEPPVPIPNTAVKQLSADDSVALAM